MQDFHNLERFVDAQQGVIDTVRRELARGKKQTHWIWFIFPQIAGLGHSTMATRFAIASLEEASAYLSHAVLGPRLLECCQLMLAAGEKPIGQILPSPDDLKFRSSMTLFSRATTDNAVFNACLEKYFDGVPDPATLSRL
ncbi:MAG: hypothetical protein JWR21_1719 [Herminiimonas sp.]|nr:hypothetical protein [Herminiimonas sp.]MDB5853614.1 hypothetical protein [Herminiimonas sp.]